MNLRVLTKSISEETEGSNRWEYLCEHCYVKWVSYELLIRVKKGAFITDLERPKTIEKNTKKPSKFLKEHLKSAEKLVLHIISV